MFFTKKLVQIGLTDVKGDVIQKEVTDLQSTIYLPSLGKKKIKKKSDF